MYLLKLTISSLQVLNFSVTSLTTVSCSHKQPTGSLPGWVRLSSCITSLINTITNISISTSINISISIATVRRWQPHRYPNLVWILLYVLSRWAIDIFLSVLFVHVSFAVWKIWGWWEKGLDLVGKEGGGRVVSYQLSCNQSLKMHLKKCNVISLIRGCKAFADSH